LGLRRGRFCNLVYTSSSSVALGALNTTHRWGQQINEEQSVLVVIIARCMVKVNLCCTFRVDSSGKSY